MIGLIIRPRRTAFAMKASRKSCECSPDIASLETSTHDGTDRIELEAERRVLRWHGGAVRRIRRA